MTSVKLTVLDVAHGNCTLIQSEDEFVMIDAAVGSFVQDAIKGVGITKIDSVIISHADADHIGGVIGLLLDDSIFIEKLYINQDAVRRTKTFEHLLVALTVARNQSRSTRVVTAINKDTDNLVYDGFEIEVLSPSPIDCVIGTGSRNLGGDQIEANGMSVVLRLIHDQQKIALITGDMNEKSLKFIKDECDCVKAKILVFPHHGGLPAGTNPSAFAEELSNLVEPELVIFSNSRRKYDNPRQEIIDGIIASDCNPRLACTQLAKGCHDNEEDLCNDHLTDIYPSKGEPKNHSCAGTIHITLDGEKTDLQQPLLEHSNYIKKFRNRKCKGALA